MGLQGQCRLSIVAALQYPGAGTTKHENHSVLSNLFLNEDGQLLLKIVNHEPIYSERLCRAGIFLQQKPGNKYFICDVFLVKWLKTL